MNTERLSDMMAQRGIVPDAELAAAIAYADACRAECAARDADHQPYADTSRLLEAYHRADDALLDATAARRALLAPAAREG